MQTKQSEDQRLASVKMEHMGQIQREKEAQAQQQAQAQLHMQKEVEVRDSQLQQLSREIENAMRQNHELTRRAEAAEQVAAEATMRLEKYVAEHEDMKQSRNRVQQEREQQGHELQQVRMRSALSVPSQGATGSHFNASDFLTASDLHSITEGSGLHRTCHMPQMEPEWAGGSATDP